MQVIPSQFYSEGWAEQENAELNMASALEADPGCCQQHIPAPTWLSYTNAGYANASLSPSLHLSRHSTATCRQRAAVNWADGGDV